MSIEFLGGFLIFIFVVMYVFFMTASFLPQYSQVADENTIEAGAWRASQALMDFLVLDSTENTVNLTALEVLSACTPYSAHPTDPKAQVSQRNYAYFHDIVLNVSNKSNFHIQADQYVIALTNKAKFANFTGTAIVNNKEIFFETFNTTTPQYTKVLIDNGTKMTAYAGSGEEYLLGNDRYLVEKIDPEGHFVILSSNVADCGKQPSSSSHITKYVRYSKIDNRILRLELTYW